MTDDDRELLELAAKGAGYTFKLEEAFGGFGDDEPTIFDAEGFGHWWNPIADDGDAFRLACKLQIPVFPYDDETSTGTSGVVAKNWGSIEANTRRAIVRAAAEIGRSIP